MCQKRLRKWEVLITSFPSLSPFPLLRLCLPLHLCVSVWSYLALSQGNRCELSVTQFFQMQRFTCDFSEMEKEQRSREREWTANVGPTMSSAAEVENRREASFILKNQEEGMGWGVGRGWGWWLGVVLHKLSSRSACIAWPTVQRDEWNVGQTPPPLSLLSFFLSFFLSLCLYPSLSALTNTTALSIFWKTGRNAQHCLSASVSSLTTINYNK